MNYIDVIIPCYNAENTLGRAVESVLVQPELGCLWLVDDASTDNTATLIQQWQQRYPQKIRAEYLASNRGPALARNWGHYCLPAVTLLFWMPMTPISLMPYRQHVLYFTFARTVVYCACR